MSRPILIVAGEASGDLHAARLLGELRTLVPDVAAFGMGGGELEEAGMERLFDSAEISVVGLVEVVKIYSRARELFDALLAAVDRRRPELAVLVDFPDFNLRLAKELKRRGVPVVYYVSPQIWAWRRGRVKTIADAVDEMLVLFPFERQFYAGHDVEVTQVGHPLVDEVPELPQAWDRPAAGGLGEERPYEIALLPGSRRSEVAVLLPLMLESVRRLAERVPVAPRLIRAPALPRAAVEEPLARSGLEVRVSEGDRFAAIAGSHLALCASGTATLEVGMLGTPLLVVYRLATWTYLAARLLVRVPHVSLANLVLERRAVPELIQGDATPERVAGEAAALLADRGRIDAMRADLAEIRGRLGEAGASRRAAERVAAHLGVEADSAAGRRAAVGGGR